MYYNIILNNKHANKVITFFVLCVSLIMLFPKFFVIISPIFGLFDEILLLLFFLFAFFDITRGRFHKIALMVLVCIALFCIVSLFSPFYRGAGITFIQSILHLKFFIIFYVLKTTLADTYLKSFLILVVALTFLGVMVNLALPGIFIEEGSTEKIRFFSFLPRVQGFQGQANVLSYFLVIILTMGSFYLIQLETKMRYALYLGFMGIMIFLILLSGSRSPLIFLPLIIFFTLKGNIKLTAKGVIMIIFACVALLGMFIFTSDTLIGKTVGNLETIGPRETAELYNPRSFLYYYGGVLFVKFFPIGSGIATFASTMSPGSGAYEMLGISQVGFVVTTDGLFDSNIASIMGELGLLGIIVFTILSYSFFKWGLKKYTTPNDRKRYKVLYIFLIFLTFKGNIFMNGGVSVLFALFLIYPGSNTLINNKTE